jgi:H+/gluconate symporter-like permease
VLIGSAGSVAGGLGVLLLVLAGAAAYLAPTIVALLRHHHQAAAIVVINLLLGWTFIGWVVSLAMACSAVRRTPPAAY